MLIVICIFFGALLYIIPKYGLGLKGIKNNHIYFDKLNARGWVGILIGTLLILFYIVLYWFPYYLTNWVILVDPVSRFLSGNDASQWFLYGFLYTIAVIVMGIRMLLKYRHNTYQQIRTGSVMFFKLHLLLSFLKFLFRSTSRGTILKTSGRSITVSFMITI